ncbi:MAG: aminoacyl-tRNA hydrolase, partial [Proteobacteria bacterium]|nr:aminoacyl-tRNA hydrolase [Pseudomonadota bacterium]
GPKYERTRHNIGFRVVDELARKHGLSWKSGVGRSDVTTIGPITTERGRERAVLLKPMEFMNLSGFATQRTAKFHDVPVDQILVVHDEVDLPFGTVRLKNGGGHGGHNGLRSLGEQLGGNAFARVRMGVGRDPNLPVGKQGDTAGWVLGDFPSSQAAAVDAMIAAACEDIETVLAKGIVPAMNQHNSRAPLA